MKARRILISAFIPSILLLAAAVGLTYAQMPEPPSSAVPRGTLGTAFTYQGQLKAGAETVNEACEMAFRLYDDATAGSQVGTAITATVAISDGLFTQPLDFGNAFTGDARWLDIRVQCPGDSVFTDLGRQPLAAAPYAQHAGSTGALHGQPVSTTAPSAGQVLEWDGAAWGPALDDDTIYSAGFGLTLVDTTFNVLPDTVQTRVTGTCTAGSTIRAINADGAVVCEPHDTRPGFNQIALDTTGWVGQFTSLIIGADGLPIISYEDRDNFALKVAHCDDITCASATLTTLDPAGEIMYTSITIGADDLPIISYYGLPEYALKVAHCNDMACTSATLNILDDPGNVGAYTSITIGADGLPIISYYDATNDDLKVAHCNDIACASATLNTLDTGGNTGRFTSIAIGIDGLPIISYQYYVADSSDLRIAHCNDAACTSAAIAVLDTAGDTAQHTSITIGTDGLPIISYYNRTDDDLRVAHCNSTTCTNAAINAPDTAGDVGRNSSITIGADSLPMISYYDHTNGNLKVARCNDVACTNAVITVVDTISDAVLYPSISSIAIGTDGMPIISYGDRVGDDLKVTHCSNPFCMPYWRRR